MAAAPPLPKSFEDAARHLLAVEEELERVCESAHFRTSRRSCEFLQYIVKVTLNGRTDSLKERSIGIDLFGRDTSYEPSSDATVRVRANEVRKRLNSYYASLSMLSAMRIDLPTGSYVPQFLSPARRPILSEPPLLSSAPAQFPSAQSVPVAVSPLSSFALMRPALLAMLVCTLLLRHQLDSREEYLRFWDHLLSGRTAMVLALSPQDRQGLASSLYPLVWVAGRYGIDATMAGDSLVGIKQDANATVQVNYAGSLDAPTDVRRRWAISSFPPPPSAGSGLAKSPTSGTDSDRAALHAILHDLRDRAPRSVSSAALLTILPEDPGTLHVEGTDAEAIRQLLEGLTVERNFPAGAAERLNDRHVFQILMYLDHDREWRRDVYWEGN